jgi:hypothetical protein
MRSTRLLLACALTAACGGGGGGGGAAGSGSADAPGGAPTGPLPAVTKVKTPPKSVFPEGTQSLRLTKSTGAFLAPDGVDRIGNVAADTRVAWTETKPGKNCASVWVAVTPRGWICADVLEPSKKPPLGYEMPRLDRAEIVPGTYGRITDAGATTWVLNDPTAKGKGKASKPAAKPAKPAAPKPTTPAPESAPASAPADDDDAADAGPPEVDPLGRTMTMGRPLVGSTNVRKYGEITVAGKAYWKTSQSDNEWVLKAHISQHRPSTYQGARLADDTGLTPAAGVRVAQDRHQGVDPQHAHQRRQAPGVAARRAADPRDPRRRRRQAGGVPDRRGRVDRRRARCGSPSSWSRRRWSVTASAGSTSTSIASCWWPTRASCRCSPP